MLLDSQETEGQSSRDDLIGLTGETELVQSIVAYGTERRIPQSPLLFFEQVKMVFKQLLLCFVRESCYLAPPNTQNVLITKQPLCSHCNLDPDSPAPIHSEGSSYRGRLPIFFTGHICAIGRGRDRT
jgi:hypothetical protein